jgi:hypothetical protein
VLLIGTGSKVEMLPPAVRAYLNGLGIQVDVMDTVSPGVLWLSTCMLMGVCTPSGTRARRTISSRRRAGASRRRCSRTPRTAGRNSKIVAARWDRSRGVPSLPLGLWSAVGHG